MTDRPTRKAVLAGFAAAAASAAAASAAEPFVAPLLSGSGGKAPDAPGEAASIERDRLGRIVRWVGKDGRSYTVQYRTDFPALRLADYPGLAAWAFASVTAAGASGLRSVANAGFAWGPDGAAPAHAAAGNPARGVFVQNGFDSEAAIARAARGRLRASHIWAEQDFLRGVEDALKLNALR